MGQETLTDSDLNVMFASNAGGAQAVAAMAYGTASVPKVDKVCGPGNQFVTMAKMLVQNDSSAIVSIDMPAGPSEVMVSGKQKWILYTDIMYITSSRAQEKRIHRHTDAHTRTHVHMHTCTHACMHTHFTALLHWVIFCATCLTMFKSVALQLREQGCYLCNGTASNS